jgi:hypothetical protein
MRYFRLVSSLALLSFLPACPPRIGSNSSASGPEGFYNFVTCGVPDTGYVLEDGAGVVLPGISVAPASEPDGTELWDASENTFTGYSCNLPSTGNPDVDCGVSPYPIYYASDNCSGTGYVAFTKNFTPGSRTDCQIVFSQMTSPQTRVLWQTTNRTANNVTVRSIYNGSYSYSASSPPCSPAPREGMFYSQVIEVVPYDGVFPSTAPSPFRRAFK